MSPLLGIDEIEGLQLDEEESEESKMNHIAPIESVSERQMSSSKLLRDSEIERWGFPEELGEREGVHMPFIT